MEIWRGFRCCYYDVQYVKSPLADCRCKDAICKVLSLCSWVHHKRSKTKSFSSQNSHKTFKISIIRRTYKSLCATKSFCIPSTALKCMHIRNCLLILFCYFFWLNITTTFVLLLDIFFSYCNFPHTHTFVRGIAYNFFFNCMQLQTLFSASQKKEWHKCFI